MLSEKQYLDLYQSSSRMIKKNSAEVLNAVRDAAFEDFRRLGFPSRKVERYKYTDMSAIFEPDYGLNLNRLEIPVDPYEAFRCDVPNLSTSLYFVVNDAFYSKALPKVELPEGVIVDSLNKIAAENPEFIEKYYAKIAKTDEDGITALNTFLAQDGLLIYVPKNVKVERTIQVINILRSEVDLMVNRRVLFRSIEVETGILAYVCLDYLGSEEVLVIGCMVAEEELSLSALFHHDEDTTVYHQIDIRAKDIDYLNGSLHLHVLWYVDQQAILCQECIQCRDAIFIGFGNLSIVFLDEIGVF